MEKIDIIKNAYGNCFEKVEGFLDENGWCLKKVIGHGVTEGFSSEDCGFKVGEYDFKLNSNCDDIWRPKSLRGISNNNGWSKIDGVNTLPKESGSFNWLKKSFYVCHSFNPQSKLDLKIGLGYEYWRPFVELPMPLY